VQCGIGGTTVPVGSAGVFGVAALAGCALFVTQLRRRNRQTGLSPGPARYRRTG
jgi:hypothetical protein